jgi:hypothetical protein|nr:MAG TPA: hypothetical protein [Caudoviricetes sp.]
MQDKMEQLEQIANALDGLAYADWCRIKAIVEQKYSPDMGKVRLTDTEGMMRMMKLELL